MTLGMKPTDCRVVRSPTRLIGMNARSEMYPFATVPCNPVLDFGQAIVEVSLANRLSNRRRGGQPGRYPSPNFCDSKVIAPQSRLV
jgi:hypothetical protein